MWRTRCRPWRVAAVDDPVRPTRVGMNLLPEHWGARSALSGQALLAHRADVFERMAAAGLDHVSLGDHVMFQAGLGNDGLIDAASVLTASEGLNVYLAVYLLVLRHPVTVARQLLTLSQLGPGRLTLGLGIAGDDRREVEACGVDPATRGRRMDESLRLLRQLLDGDEVTIDGEFFTLESTRLRPALEASVPLIVGGRSGAALRRAGTLGDGWLGLWNSAERFAEAVGTIERHAADVGRCDVTWQHGMSFWCGFGPDRTSARELVAPAMERFYRVPFEKFERYVPFGTPAEVAEFIRPYVEAGAGTVNVVPCAGSDAADIDAVAEVRDHLLRA
jgi:alkanesulfonate monooxygenase SsuD/methylene tetrahydromethanopterin reductase-like flavin-dependent oxidoreductase (luciferase family)